MTGAASDYSQASIIAQRAQTATYGPLSTLGHPNPQTDANHAHGPAHAAYGGRSARDGRHDPDPEPDGMVGHRTSSCGEGSGSQEIWHPGVSVQTNLTRHNPFFCRLQKGDDSVENAAHDPAFFIASSIAASTRQAYLSDLARFHAWGGSLPASPETVAAYLASHASTLAPASLARHLATLSKVHEANAWPNPCRGEMVRAVMRGIRRVRGTAQDQARPLLREELFLMLDAMGRDPRALRDRALLLIGWAGGFRCSELFALDLADVEPVREGLVLHIRRAKTDQTGAGRKVGIPMGRTRHCPVSAFEAWQTQLAAQGGPLFRPIDRNGYVRPTRLTGDSVSAILRARLADAGIASDGFSGHSLRAGLATSAAKAGVPSHKIRAQTGHASDAMLGRYIRDAEMFEGNAAGALL